MKSIVRVGMVICISLSVVAYAKRAEQPIAGQVTLRNDTQEEIEVYFFSTRDKKRRKPICHSTTRLIPPLDSTTVRFANCSINVIEVHHTPEEDFERVTKEFLSLEDQDQETFFVYQGPNRIVQIRFKTR